MGLKAGTLLGKKAKQLDCEFLEMEAVSDMEVFKKHPPYEGE